MAASPSYTANRIEVDGIEVARLSDGAHQVEVSIAPSIGNMAYEIRVRGKNILWFPYDSPVGLRAEPKLCGVPFLGPWANRLSEDAYWASGKKYVLNPSLGNIRRDPHQKPIHGLLNFSPRWTLMSLGADARSCWATSRLEFWRYPDLMAQFPFAHTLTMTYRLSDGEVEVETCLENQSVEPIPVAVGFHPYFQLHDAPRDSWKVHLAARDHLLLSGLLIPTGQRKEVEFADPHELRVSQLDDVFSNLIRDDAERACFWVEGRSQRISVTYGPKYRVAVVYAPAGKEFVCFEPMAAITDAFNLAQSGAYQELQAVAPGEQWVESFWITTSGF